MTMLENRASGISRRAFLGSLAALAVVPPSLARAATTPISIKAINNVTINVSDPTRSLEWYQNLFGLPIAGRQGNTTLLRVGSGPQFMAISGNANKKPGFNHLCP